MTAAINPPAGAMRVACVLLLLAISGPSLADVFRPAYLELRERPDELFIETVKRVGIEPFKERVYAAD